ncbi:DUF4914 family protein [Draconibacterium sediminis]|uniref:DUF4914 domain-containing protein n=1 Tax=Draconibacterium sediminis TaxID=1544798 RepID=A0A0D8J5Z6_9BACT|nr:DUF4914 family protein [Draconibacterium sediminis]KJF41951.1 hypothetical protein LH29_21925 [Draconibacterium sediminis]
MKIAFSDFKTKLDKKGVKLPENIQNVLSACKSFTCYNTTEELADAATNGKENNEFAVSYDIEGKGTFTEAIVHRVQNGISVNYTEAYMRRRDPGTMVIGDDKPTGKQRFSEKYNYPFSDIQKETFDWLKENDLAVFFYFAGRQGIGSLGIAIAPANAGFFAMGLSMLQEIVAIDELAENSELKSVIYVAPVFRHTHFEGKQVVVHNRLDDIHELYSYNLYPGPSAKKGLYGVLLTQGEKEEWVTAHCSAVQSISPYDIVTTFMHEGASGGGKSELHQHIVRETDGRVLLGKNSVTGETRYITIPRTCNFLPIADDMAFCHPSFQQKNGKLGIMDAENAWFVRVDSVNQYGDDPVLEKTTINPKKPLLFLNIDTKPESTALIWNHIEDEPGKRCPNPRVVLPRESVDNTINGSVSVDVRSFGIRTPKCSKEDPSYGIVGLFHVLPPALAWLWRLVAPRGHKNPSIVGTGAMESEGVGSYWPFATGDRIIHANLLLKQIIETPRTIFSLVPNQNIGVWEVGFKPQLLMREYLTRRGGAKLKDDQIQAARCPLLGYELNYLTIESSKIPSRFLKVYNQVEVGTEGYDAGAQVLQEFFNRELKKFLHEDLFHTGRKIIDACLSNASIEEYNQIIPMDYEYSFNNIEDYEQSSYNNGL